MYTVRENKFNFKGYIGCHVYVLSGRAKKIIGGYIDKIIIEQSSGKYVVKYQIVFGDTRYNHMVLTRTSDRVYTSIENLNKGIAICDEECELYNSYYMMKCDLGDRVIVDPHPKDKDYCGTRLDWIVKCRLTIEDKKVTEEYKLKLLRNEDFVHGWCNVNTGILIDVKKDIKI